MQTKQLLADKAYLEEHLKNRGTKNRIREKNQEKTDLDVTGKVNTFSKFNQSVACSHEGGNRVADETVREENKDNLNTTNTVTTTVVKREINILDDLEKEFNKQRLQQKRGVDSWQKGGVVKEMTGRGSGSFDERQSANNSDSGLGTEVCSAVTVHVYSETSDKGHSLLRTQYKNLYIKDKLFFFAQTTTLLYFWCIFNL